MNLVIVSLTVYLQAEHQYLEFRKLWKITRWSAFNALKAICVLKIY